MSKTEGEPLNHQEAANNRTYPCVKPQEGEPDWRKIHLYGITGWMSSWYGMENTEVATAFGGYFKFDPEDKTIEGELIDIWGNARIDGNLHDKKGSLYILKEYTNRIGPAARYPIEYIFEKRKNLWVGNFALDHKEQFTIKGEPITGGRAEAVLTKFHPNAFGIVMGPLGWHRPTPVRDYSYLDSLLEEEDKENFPIEPLPF